MNRKTKWIIGKKMKLTIGFNKDTGLMDIISSGGTLSLSQTEMAALYVVLKKALGLRGRFLIWKRRRMFSKKVEGPA